MKKLLLIPAMLMAFTAFAQTEEEAEGAVMPKGTPSNFVLTVEAMDAATEYGNEEASVSYFLQPLSETKYSTFGLGEDIILRGYTDPVKNKSAKYIYSIKYYKAGYKSAVEDQNGEAPVFNNENSYTVFINENEPDIKLSVCAVWPNGKTYVEWIHNFSNIVATDANVYGYLYVAGNELPTTYTYINKFAKTADTDGSNFNKYYTKTNTNSANISTNFLKGDSQTSLVYLNSESTQYNKGEETGVYKVSLDYATGELTLTPCDEHFELFIDGFTTFSAPFSYTLADGTKAYTLVYDEESTSLKAQPIKGNSIDANTPVIIKANTPGEYEFTITGEASFTTKPEPTQSKKVYIPDTKMEGSVLIGVNHPHWLDVYSGTQEINYRYTLSGGLFNKNKALSTKKNYDNPIVPQYTCYVELPSDIEVAPETIEIIFLEEDADDDMIYVHFTDKDGNYTDTFENEYFGPGEYSCLTKYGDGSYYLFYVNFTEEPTYYVLSKSPYPDAESVENDKNEISLMAYDANSWANFEGEVYHEGGVSDPTKEEIQPFQADKGTYEITFNPDVDSKPTLKLTVSTGIENVEINKTENEVMYNIFGMPVDENYKGIVIKNGKKLILR